MNALNPKTAAWRLFFALASVLLLSIWSGNHVAQAHASTDWPTYLHDITRSSNDTDETVISASSASTLQPLWTFKTGGTIASQASVVGTTAYEGSWDGYEYAIDMATGNQLWKTYLGITSNSTCSLTAGVTSSATVQNGIVYVGGGDAFWYALDASNGNILWKVQTGDNIPTGGNYNWTSPLIYNGYAYVGTSSFCDQPLVQGKLLEVSLTTHQITRTLNLVNNTQVGGTIWTTPAVDASTNTIYVTTGTLSGVEPLAEAIVSIDVGTMTVKDSWQINTATAGGDADWGTSPLLYTTSGGTKMVSGINKNGVLYSFNASNLSQGPVWQYTAAIGGSCPQCGQGSISSGVFAQNKVFYAAGKTTINSTSYNGSVRAFDPATGSIAWQTGTSKTPYTALAYANGVIMVAPGDMLQVLDASNGNTLYITSLGSTAYGAPSISNGTILVGTVDGVLHAFRPTSGGPTIQKLGGIDLDTYCKSLGFSGISLNGSTWICTGSSTAVDMNAACTWQYSGAVNIYANQDSPGNPYTWACYSKQSGSTPTPTPTATPSPTPSPTPVVTPTPSPTPTGSPTKLGGMNLTGFCQSSASGSAIIVNGIWFCNGTNAQINMTQACTWQYPTATNISANQDGPGNPYTWTCYSNQISSTPTPTPSPTPVVTPTPSPTPTVTPTPTPTATPSPTPSPTPTSRVTLGGLNLDGYCHSLGNNGVSLTSGTWICNGTSTPIVMTQACTWQYPGSPNISASQLNTTNPYTWVCYSN